MQNFNSHNVYYLEPFDFNEDLSILINEDIVNPYTEAPLFSGLSIVMIQGNFCGYCTSFKPHFQQLADEAQTIDFGTIQIDGEYQDFYRKNIDSIIHSSLQGVPTIVKMYRGVYVDTYSGPLRYDSLKKWVYS
jgi:thiol-disulfide isomerase/thioredoxin